MDFQLMDVTLTLFILIILLIDNKESLQKKKAKFSLTNCVWHCQFRLDILRQQGSCRN